MHKWWEEEWYIKALELFPEEREAIVQTVSNPMGLWITLNSAFRDAYADVPFNEDLIQRIYHFAAWCLRRQHTGGINRHLPTCVIVGLYESIPTIEAARTDMPRWFTREEVLALRQTFQAHLTDAEFDDLAALFPSSARIGQPLRTSRRKHG